ncbi:MAG: hypothetical protein OZ948_00900 [Deltaproteobacteria bacterium]|nr:hypothetical protein [Deltaproteobacteria bacterium]
MPAVDRLAVRPLPQLDELRAWVAPGPGPRVTVHLPIQRAVPDLRQNAPLLERAAREVEARLLALGVDPARAGARAAALLAIDLELARLPAGTRALVALQDSRALHAIALPDSTPYRVDVGESFVLRPLLQALQRHAPFRVLTVSLNRVALWESGPDGLRETPLAGVPASLPEALGQELTAKQIRVRGTGRGGTQPVFYSHGSARDERKLDLQRFHEALARTLGPALADRASPIVLAATEDHQGGLRALVKLPSLLGEALVGNFDHATAAELAERCAPVVERWRARRADQAGEDWERARNRGKAIDLLDDVGAAALAGRVWRLWIDAERSLAGRLDPDTGCTLRGDGYGDALDALCELVLARGGEVIPVDAARLPSANGVAAELR